MKEYERGEGRCEVGWGDGLMCDHAKNPNNPQKPEPESPHNRQLVTVIPSQNILELLYHNGEEGSSLVEVVHGCYTCLEYQVSFACEVVWSVVLTS